MSRKKMQAPPENLQETPVFPPSPEPKEDDENASDQPVQPQTPPFPNMTESGQIDTAPLPSTETEEDENDGEKVCCICTRKHYRKGELIEKDAVRWFREIPPHFRAV